MSSGRATTVHNKRLRVVIDTVGFVRTAMRAEGPWGTLMRNYGHVLEVVLSDSLAAEVLEVLSRPRVRHRFPTVGAVGLNAVMDAIGRADYVELDVIPRICGDPKDDMVIATAVAGNATYIATEDRDLLDLVEHAGIRIIDGRELLRILREASGPDSGS